MNVLKTENLTKIYGKGNTEVIALNNANISVEQGQFVSVIGTSGSGKSTLLNMLGGLDNPTSGKVFVDGKEIFSLKNDSMTIFRRRKIGFVFQSFNLVPVLNVYENIIFPIQLDGGSIDKEYINNIIETLGLDKKVNAMPNQLSGGQQQRVAIAWALATKPAIILADEPTGNLDPDTAWDIMNLLNDINMRGTTVVVATHAKDIVDKMKKRVIHISKGDIVRDDKKGGYDCEI